MAGLAPIAAVDRRAMVATHAHATHPLNRDATATALQLSSRTVAAATPNNTSSSNNNNINGQNVTLFDVPLHSLFAGRPRTVVEWHLRVDDPGECLWVGASVGADLTDIQSGAAPTDMNHMCMLMAPPSRKLRVRLSLGTHGAIKLSVHDASGRQLDDGRTPHWPQGRLAYPQVAFGGRAGAATLTRAPEVVSHA